MAIPPSGVPGEDVTLLTALQTLRLPPNTTAICCQVLLYLHGKHEGQACAGIPLGLGGL